MGACFGGGDSERVQPASPNSTSKKAGAQSSQQHGGKQQTHGQRTGHGPKNAPRLPVQGGGQGHRGGHGGPHTAGGAQRSPVPSPQPSPHPAPRVFLETETGARRFNLLMLGAGESGKSTLLKQLKNIYGGGYSQQELRLAKPYVLQSVREAMRALALHSALLAETKGLDTKVAKELEPLREEYAKMPRGPQGTDFDEKMCGHFETLLADKGIQETRRHTHLFQIIDTHEYMFQHMRRFAEQDYVPTFQDILYARDRTVGIYDVKLQFEKQGEVYHMYDMGGQRNERRKWTQLLNKRTPVSGIVYVAALSSYNQGLWEKTTVNRMMEALRLFDQIVNLDEEIGIHIPFFLVLNKYDLFVRKVDKYPVEEYLPKLVPRDDPPQGEEEALQRIQDLFLQRCRNAKRQIYPYIITAVDAADVRKTFPAIKQNLQRHHGLA